MDFYSMKRRELQALCKTHGIPANLKNREMADRLSSLLQEEEGLETIEEPSVEKEMDEVARGLSLKPVPKNAKKVKFSPEEDEVFEYEPTVRRNTGGNGRKSKRQSVVKFASELSATVSPTLGGGGRRVRKEDGECGGAVGREGRTQRLLRRNAVKDEESLEKDGEAVKQKGNMMKSRRQSVVKSASENLTVVLPPWGGRKKAMDVTEEIDEGVGRKGRHPRVSKRNVMENEGSSKQNVSVLEEATKVRKSRRQLIVKSTSENSTVVLATGGGRKKAMDVVEEITEVAGRKARPRRVSNRNVLEDEGSLKQNVQIVEENTNLRKSRRQSIMKSASNEPTVLLPPPGGRKKATEVIEEAEGGREGRLRRGSKRNAEGSSKQNVQAPEEEINVRKSSRQAVRKSASDEPTILLPQSGRSKRATELIKETRIAAGRKERIQRHTKCNAAEDGGSSKQSGQVFKDEANAGKSRRQSEMKSSSDDPTILSPQPGQKKRVRELIEETKNDAHRKERIQRTLKRNSAKDKESSKQILEGDVNVGENSVRKPRGIAYRQGKDTQSVKSCSATSDNGKDMRKESRREAIVEEIPALEPMIDAHSGVADDTVQKKEGSGSTEQEEVKSATTEPTFIKQPSANVIAESAVSEHLEHKLEPVLNSSHDNVEQSNKNEESGIASDAIDQKTPPEVPNASSDIQQFVSVSEDVEISEAEKLNDVPSHLGKMNFDMYLTEKPEDTLSGPGKDNSQEGVICSDNMDDDTTDLLDGQANNSQDDPVVDFHSSAILLDHAGQLDGPLNSENEVEDEESFKGASSFSESDNLTRTKQLDLQDKVSSSEALKKIEAPTLTTEIVASEVKLDTTSDCTNLGTSVELRALDIDAEEAEYNTETHVVTKNCVETHMKTPFPEFSNVVSRISEDEMSDMKVSIGKSDDKSLISEKDNSPEEVLRSNDFHDDTRSLLDEQIIQDVPVSDGFSYAEQLDYAGDLEKTLILENESGEEESLTGVCSLSEIDNFINMKRLEVTDEIPSNEALLSNEALTLNPGAAESVLTEDPACNCSNKDVEQSNKKGSHLCSVELCRVNSDVQEAKNKIETHEETSLLVNVHDIPLTQKEEFSGSEYSVGATKACISSSENDILRNMSFDVASIDNLNHISSDGQCEADQDDVMKNSLSVDQSSGEGELKNNLDIEKELTVKDQLISEGGLSGSDLISHSAAQADAINLVLHKDHVRSTSKYEETYCTDKRDSSAVGTSPIKTFALPQSQENYPSEDQENNSGGSLESCKRDDVFYKKTAFDDHTYSSGGGIVGNDCNRVCSEMVTSDAMISAAEAMINSQNNDEEKLHGLVPADAAEYKVGDGEPLVEQASPRCDIMQQSASGDLHEYSDTPAKAKDATEETIQADSPITLGFLSEVFKSSATTGLERVKGVQSATADISSPALGTCEPSRLLDMKDFSDRGTGLNSHDLYESDGDVVNKKENEEPVINAYGDKQFSSSEDCEVTFKKISANRIDSNLVSGSVSQCEFSCHLEKDLYCNVLALPKANHDLGQEVCHIQEQFTSNSSSRNPVKYQVSLNEADSMEKLAVDAVASTQTVKDASIETISSECKSSSEKDNRSNEVVVDGDGSPIERTLFNNDDIEDDFKDVEVSKSSSEGFLRNYEASLNEINQVDQGETSIDRIHLNYDETVDVLEEVRASESSYDGLFRSYKASLEETNNQVEVGLDQGMASAEKHLLNSEETGTAVENVSTAETTYGSPVKNCDTLLESTSYHDVQVEQREVSDEEMKESYVERPDAFLIDTNNMDEVKVAKGAASIEMLSDKDIEETLKEVLLEELSLLSAPVESTGGIHSKATYGNENQECVERKTLNFSDCLHHNVEISEDHSSSKLLQISEDAVSSSAVDSCRRSVPPERSLMTIREEISVNIAEVEGGDTASMLQVSSPSLNQQFVDNGPVAACELVSDIDKSCSNKLDRISTDGQYSDREETARKEEENFYIMDEVSEAKKEHLLAEVTSPSEENLAEKPDKDPHVSGFKNILDHKSAEIAVAIDAGKNYADAGTSHDDGSKTRSMSPLQSVALQTKTSSQGSMEKGVPNTEQVPPQIMETKNGRARLLSKTHKLFTHHDMKENPPNLKSPKFATATKVLSKRQPLGSLPNK